MKRWSWLSFLAGAVPVALILGGILVGVEADHANQDAYRACLSAQGYYEGDPNTDLEGLATAAENC